jgi:hypothetical protein
LGETVYKGSFDWITGILTITHARAILKGNEGWAQMDDSLGLDGTYRYLVSTPLSDTMAKPVDNNHILDAICSHFSMNSYLQIYNKSTIGMAFQTEGRVSIRTTHATLEEFKAYLAAQVTAGTPVEIIYPLLEPRKIQLTRL